MAFMMVGLITLVSNYLKRWLEAAKVYNKLVNPN